MCVYASCLCCVCSMYMHYIYEYMSMSVGIMHVCTGILVTVQYITHTVNVEIFDARKFRALWTGPIIFNFRAH